MSAEPQQSRICRKAERLHTESEAATVMKPKAKDAGIAIVGAVCMLSLLSVIGERGDSITTSDVLKQLKLVVLQLSHVMRISHEKTSVVEMNRWSEFEYCSLWASNIIQVRTITSNKIILFCAE